MKNLKGLAFPFRVGTSGSIAMSSGPTHVRESVLQLISTEPGERVMEIEYGCPLRDIIFDPLDITVISIVRRRILNSLTRWEPNVIVRESDITVANDSSTNSVHVTISGRVRNTMEEFVTNVEFRR